MNMFAYFPQTEIFMCRKILMISLDSVFVLLIKYGFAFVMEKLSTNFNAFYICCHKRNE